MGLTEVKLVLGFIKHWVFIIGPWMLGLGDIRAEWVCSGFYLFWA